MSSNLITVHAFSPLERAVQIMKESNIKKLPVILNNEIVGIVTEIDLSRTIDVFSGAIDELIDFYETVKHKKQVERFKKLQDFFYSDKKVFYFDK